MLFASDYKDNRIHIDETHSNQEYYCPYCGAPLITKKGEQRRHHFAHKKDHICSDSWERSGSYDLSPWHNDWQSLFPKENQEVKLTLGDTKHRADVLIDRRPSSFLDDLFPERKQSTQQAGTPRYMGGVSGSGHIRTQYTIDTLYWAIRQNTIE